MVTGEEPCQAPEAQALRLLAGREHSRHELRRKLAQRGYADEVIEQTLDGLTAQGLLDDRRFAEEYTLYRYRKGFGPLRIRVELRERAIDESLIDEALRSDELDWRAHLRETSERKFGGGRPADRSELGKRARFLSQRGFPDEDIRSLLLDE